MPRSKSKKLIDTTIIGAGTLATALAIALRRSGYRIREIVSRDTPKSISRARRLAKRVGARATTLQERSFAAKVLWICVPDDAIPEVAIQLAVSDHWKGKIVAHCSGAVASSVLDPLREAGAKIASVHPLMTFVSSSQSTLDGVPCSMEGDPKALRVLRPMVENIGGRAFRIAADAKPAYHLFGFFSSPALVVLLAAAQQVGELAGFDPRKSRELMHPIVRQTLENAFRSTPQQGFSGPLRRGDIATLRKHLEVLKGEPELLALYKALSRIALQRLPVSNGEEIKKLID